MDQWSCYMAWLHILCSKRSSNADTNLILTICCEVNKIRKTQCIYGLHVINLILQNQCIYSLVYINCLKQNYMPIGCYYYVDRFSRYSSLKSLINENSKTILVCIVIKLDCCEIGFYLSPNLA